MVKFTAPGRERGGGMVHKQVEYPPCSLPSPALSRRNQQSLRVALLPLLPQLA